MTAVEVVEQALGELGGCTSGQIANVMINGGHEGYPFSALSCPVSKYLQAKLGDDEGVCVGPRMASVGPVSATFETEPEMFYQVTRVILPVSVQAFIQRFDGGEFPELILHTP